MKFEKEKQLVVLTYDELLNCKIVKANRCGYTTEEEAIENGFSNADWEKFLKRAEKIKKVIKKNGFSRASFFTLAKDFEGDIYLLDGQGRRMALKLLCEKDNFDFSDWEFSCILFVNPMTIDEMSKLIIDLNTGNTNWQNKEIRRNLVMSTENEDCINAYNETKLLVDKYGISDYNANLLVFGEKASKMKSLSLEVFGTKDFVTTKDLFTEAYIKFITTSCYRYDVNGEKVKRSSDVISKIKSVNICISFVSCLRSIVDGHNGNIEESRKDVMGFVDNLIKFCDCNDQYLKAELTVGKDKSALASKVKKYYKKNCVVKSVLYA